MTLAYIGLGSNLGDRMANIDGALELLDRINGVSVLRVAEVVETDPLGPPQPKYLNTVCEVESALEPQVLLEECLRIEAEAGRVRKADDVRWGPRVIDLDLLLYGQEVIESDKLTVPHPRMHEREFVLKPLGAVAPQACHPVLKRNAAELLAALSGDEADVV